MLTLIEPIYLRSFPTYESYGKSLILWYDPNHVL